MKTHRAILESDSSSKQISRGRINSASQICEESELGAEAMHNYRVIKGHSHFPKVHKVLTVSVGNLVEIRRAHRGPGCTAVTLPVIRRKVGPELKACH